MMDGRGFRKPPVNVGDEIDVKIEAVGEKGDGLARVNGFILFVPGVKEGDEVRVKVTRILKKVGFAEVVGKGGAGPERSEEASSEEGSSEEFEQVSEEADGQEESEESEEPEEAEDSENFGEE